MLGKAVDGESDGIELFAGVERRAVGIEAPVDSTVFTVDEPIADIIAGAESQVCVFLSSGKTSLELAGAVCYAQRIILWQSFVTIESANQ